MPQGQILVEVEQFQTQMRTGGVQMHGGSVSDVHRRSFRHVLQQFAGIYYWQGAFKGAHAQYTEHRGGSPHVGVGDCKGSLLAV